MKWFSTKLRFAVIVETLGLREYRDSVFVFQTQDFDTAFQLALKIGRSKEQQYLNGDGQHMAWKLATVISLDIIQRDSLDCAEIYSEAVATYDDGASLDTQYNPELSQPTQTV